jgi:hypothetical protein
VIEQVSRVFVLGRCLRPSPGRHYRSRVFLSGELQTFMAVQWIGTGRFEHISLTISSYGYDTGP